jgi:hypothetical protein
MLFCLPALFLTQAQIPHPTTLDELLQRLENNLNIYDAKVPSLFCNEHVISRIDPSQTLRDTVTDSIFRLKRTVNPDHTTSLVESREIKTINSVPATGDTIGGPAVLSGAFSGGIAAVSLAQQSCMRYKLLPHRPNKAYIVEFTSIFKHGHPNNCLLREDGFGRVLIDPATMQIQRMELTAPDHTMEFPKDASGFASPPANGLWKITIDYAPVPLGTETFWLPATISSSVTVASRFHSTNWLFKARYTNYHKLEVTSRIVPTP